MFIKLRHYQEEAIACVYDAIQSGYTRLLISLPTGSGKTVIFSELCRQAKGHVLVIAHRAELIEQACEKIRTISNQQFIVGIEKGEQRADPKSKVVVASIRSLQSDRLKRLLKEHQFDLVIYDECHHAAAEDNKRVLRTLGAFDSNWMSTLIGFTATTTRGDGIGLEEVFELIVYQRSILEMIKDKYLVPFIGYRINTDIDLINILNDRLEFNTDLLSEAVNIESRNALVARSIQELARDRRTIVFCVTVVHAVNMARALNTLGVPSAVIYGDMPKDKRSEVLRLFKTGHFTTLTNVGVLTEGFDDPEVSCIAMAKPTKSEGLYAQCIGRGARPAAGKQNCLILDFVDLSDLSLMTLPSLLGLPRELDLMGTDGVEAIETFRQLQFDYPGFEVEAGEISLSEIKTRAESFDPLRMCIHPDITAITPNAWCSLGAQGLALYFLNKSKLCSAVILKNTTKGKRYLVLMNNKEVAQFSKILDAVEATDYEISQMSELTATSARENAPWRLSPITNELKRALANLKPPRTSESIGEALHYLIFDEHNQRRFQRKPSPLPIWKSNTSTM